MQSVSYRINYSYVIGIYWKNLEVSRNNWKYFKKEKLGDKNGSTIRNTGDIRCRGIKFR